MEKKVEQYAKHSNKGKKGCSRKVTYLNSFQGGWAFQDPKEFIYFDMPYEYEGSNSFNVIDLSPYCVGTQVPNLRSNSLQEAEHDMNMEKHEDDL
ncbi:hypothetical protein CR513_28071, partial [Mucuna pruriens]